MKGMLYKIILSVLVLLISNTSCVFAFASADETEKAETYSEMYYLKLSNGNKEFTVEITYDGEEDTEPVAGVNVQFHTGFDEMYKIADATTDLSGRAILQIENNYVLPVNEEGYFYIQTIFEGNDKFDASESEVTFIDASLDLRLEENEGEKNIIVNLYRFDIDGGKMAISDEDIYIYVPRMFNRLQIGDGYLEEGEATIEFPKDLPGDAEGEVTIIARLEDHGDFGTIEKMENINWGLKKTNAFAGDHRALWTEIAPTWMIVSLIIMLLGVWGHYAYAIIQLFRIKKNV